MGKCLKYFGFYSKLFFCFNNEEMWKLWLFFYCCKEGCWIEICKFDFFLFDGWFCLLGCEGDVDLKEYMVFGWENVV